MQPRILPLSVDGAPEAARGILRATEGALGMLPNLHRTLAHAPAALRAYADAARALAGGRLSARLREQIAVAVAGTNGCAYCASAHTALGKGAGVAEDELAANVGAESADPQVAPVLALVRELIERRGRVSDASIQAVRAAGFGDAELVEIVAHVGLNTLTNLFNVFARTEIDFPKVELPVAV